MLNKLSFLFVGGMLWVTLAYSQCGTTDHAGANVIITSSTTMGGTHINIGRFQVEMGATLSIDSACRFLEVEADTIIVYGSIDGDGKGDLGGSGGAGGSYANGSGVPGHGGYAGLPGYGSGGGIQGASAGDGGTQTQICGGFLCSGTRDGFNGGGGGAGGGSGGSYGGKGGAGGYGAFGSGFSVADGGDYGAGGTQSLAYGTSDGTDISWGSGGAGGGGGGGGWSAGTSGGPGGAGGGMVSLKASSKMTISGSISCNGDNGANGGNGGGESDDNSMDCSTSGYNACGICSESVFDAAGGAGGAAGGGSGGGILLECTGTLTITGALSAIGGSGGTAGIPDSLYGNCFDYARGGAGGGGGRIKIMFNPCLTNLINPTQNISGGLGGSGLLLGNNGNGGSYRADLIAESYVPLTGGTIAPVDSVFCDYGDVPLIGSLSLPTGGISGSYTYQWQYSTTDSLTGFVNYPGQSSATCNPGLISTTTWYRRKAISGSCEEYSNAVKAEVIDCSFLPEIRPLDFQAYPIPTSGTLTIETTEPLKAGSVIKVYNQLGDAVYELILPMAQRKAELQLKVKPGVYFVVVNSESQCGMRSFVVE